MDRHGRKVEGAPKLWDEKMTTKKKSRRRKTRMRTKRAAFEKDDAIYRLTSYGEHRLRQKRSTRVGVAADDEEGVVEIITAVDPDYVKQYVYCTE